MYSARKQDLRLLNLVSSRCTELGVVLSSCSGRRCMHKTHEVRLARPRLPTDYRPHYHGYTRGGSHTHDAHAQAFSSLAPREEQEGRGRGGRAKPPCRNTAYAMVSTRSEVDERVQADGAKARTDRGPRMPRATLGPSACPRVMGRRLACSNAASPCPCRTSGGQRTTR